LDHQILQLQNGSKFKTAIPNYTYAWQTFLLHHFEFV